MASGSLVDGCGTATFLHKSNKELSLRDVILGDKLLPRNKLQLVLFVLRYEGIYKRVGRLKTIPDGEANQPFADKLKAFRPFRDAKFSWDRFVCPFHQEFHFTRGDGVCLVEEPPETNFSVPPRVAIPVPTQRQQ